MAVFSAIPWFKVVERYPLSGEERSFKRRDLRRGTPPPCYLPPLLMPEYSSASPWAAACWFGHPLTCRHRATPESRTLGFTFIILSPPLSLHAAYMAGVACDIYHMG